MSACSLNINKIQTNQNDFELSNKDINYIQKFYVQNEYNNLLELPSKTSRPKVTEFFLILQNRSSTRWIKAYLFLLTIVPEIFISEETDC